MKTTTVAIMLVMALFSETVSLAQDQAFLKEVELHVRRLANSDEGLADPKERERLQKAMSEGGDWDGALLRLLDPNKYDQQIGGRAIDVLELRGSFGRPEVEAGLMRYFDASVRAAEAHDRNDPLFGPVVRAGIRGLASRFAKSGGPDLLLDVLEYTTSTEERLDPLLDEYNVATIADALLEKGDSRHVSGMRKLLATTKDVAVQKKLERAIANAENIQLKASPKPSLPLASSPLHPTATPIPYTPTKMIEENSASVVEDAWSLGPWLVGIAALLVIVAVIFKRRS